MRVLVQHWLDSDNRFSKNNAKLALTFQFIKIQAAEDALDFFYTWGGFFLFYLWCTTSGWFIVQEVKLHFFSLYFQADIDTKVRYMFKDYNSHLFIQRLHLHHCTNKTFEMNSVKIYIFLTFIF